MTTAITVRNMDDLARFAKMAASSGLFGDVKDAAQAAVKVAAGAELGLGPIQSLTGLHVMKGKVTLGANLQAALARRAGYSWRIIEHTTDVCRLMWVSPTGDEMGEVAFSMEDARRANLGGDNWRKHPKNMLFARAITNAIRWMCPEIAIGVYEPDEVEDAPPAPTRPSPAEVEAGYRAYLATPSPAETVATVASMPAARRPEWVDTGVIPGRGEPLPELLPAPSAALPEMEAVECAALPELETPPPPPPDDAERRSRGMRRLHAVAKERYGLDHAALRDLVGVESLASLETSAIWALAYMIEAPDVAALARAWAETAAEDRAVLAQIKDYLKHYLATK